MSEPTIRPERLRQVLEQIGSLGRTASGGYSRTAYSPADGAGRRYVAQLLTGAGLRCEQDSVGNLIGILPGSADLPLLLTGSHLDTVPDGGLFDGALGVVAAVECALSIAERGIRLRHPLAVVAFQEEEGTRLGGTFGSRAMMGLVSDADLAERDWRGAALGERMAEVGLAPDALMAARRDPVTIAAFVELHVEQGGLLAEAHRPVGIVEGIFGLRRYSVRLQGEANHAGTTPMGRRKDALMAAAELMLALRAAVLAEVDAGATTVMTIGAVQVQPGQHNIIPREATFSIDLRDLSQERLDRLEARLQALAQACPLPTVVERFTCKRPVLMHPDLREQMAAAAQRASVPYLELPSGAGHDAWSLGQFVPTAMLFVPSEGGISHSPAESTNWEDAALGTQVLLQTLLALDQAL